MPIEKLTAAYWNSKNEILEAATQGWNPLMRLPKLLQEAYPELKKVTFGFFHESDLPEVSSLGWEHMTRNEFDVDEFKKSALPARYGLTDDGSGLLKHGDNYLMFMGKNFRKKLVAARNQYHEERYVESIEGKAHTMTGDPRAAEMAEYSSSTLESAVLQPKRGPGRPPKKK